MSIAALKDRDLLSLADLSSEEIGDILSLAAEMKAGKLNPRCNKVLGLIFRKASTRTRVSFSVAMYQLGGQVIDLNANNSQLGRGEPIVDTARVLDRYLDILAIRTYEQEELEVFARYAKIPVINALTDLEHPCQILADLLTVKEQFGTLNGLTLSYFGDGNNVAHSLLIGCALAGMNIRIATPEHYKPNPTVVEQAQKIAGDRTQVLITSNAIEAAKDAQVLYTDVWASMGQEDSASERIPLFKAYQVNETLLSHAANDAIVLHCLPAHREEEITDAVLEGTQSKVWDQAENRLHAQKALLVSLLGAD